MAEGITDYYGALTLRRAGLTKPAEYLGEGSSRRGATRFRE